ncbi:hypothetical protein FQN54_008649 [Arachnomyces sp. PD_36]|nr:hypothetical protein FQN54_008649 [Arachnomyces sp. PD_36]
MEESIDRLRNLEHTVEHFESVCTVPPKQRHTNVSDLVKSIVPDAYEHGIPPGILERIIDAITKPNHVDQGSVTSLIKNLYPTEKVSPDVVTKVVCSLGPSKSKPPAATQALLLRWLILVYDVLEDRSHLSKLYAVLFNYLDMISLRRPLCHILSLITRRKHVKPFRIQALMELLRNVGEDDRELQGLLRVFKSYYPDIIVGENVGSSRKAAYFFKHPDPEWVAHMKAVQEANYVASKDSNLSTFQVVRRGAVKRSRVEGIIPEVQTSRVQENFTSLEELRSVDDLVQRLDVIELPNQMVSALKDPLAQKYLSLAKSEAASRRLESWLDGFFGDELDRASVSAEDEEPGALEYVLEAALEFTRYSKKIPSSVDSFLRKYLKYWDGQENRDAVLGLLEYLPLQPYQELRRDYFSLLENVIFGQSIQSKIVVLRYYSTVIRHWGTSIRAEEPAPSPTEALAIIRQLIEHAELLSLTILESPSNLQNTSDTKPSEKYLSVLRFYTTVAQLYSHAPTRANIRLTIPPPQTVYSIAFTQTLTHISILSSILAVYKSAFEGSLTSTFLHNPSAPDPLYPTKTVGQFNGYIMDICNLIWRNRALNTDDPNALGCSIPATTVASLKDYVHRLNDAEEASYDESSGTDMLRYFIPSMFSLSHHVALCGFSAACFRDFEDETPTTEEGDFETVRLGKPVTQKALVELEKRGGVKISWQEYRLKALEWLDERGSEGIGYLMRSTMKALRK